ncbi:MAG: sigma 54-interacting transcriptional regulator [Sulfurihydrogenibium sp.]
MELSILENLSSGIIFIDKDRKIKYLNKLAKEMLKDKKEGDSCFGIFYHCKNCPIESFKEGENIKLENFDTKLSCCGKSICYSITPIYENGKLVGFLEEFRDSSKLQEQIEEIKKEKEFNKIILDSVIDAIVVVDEKGTIIEYNQVAKNILCKEMDVKGMNIEVLLNKKLSELPTNREDIFIETPAIGKVKVSLVATPIKNYKGRLISFYIVPECMISNDNLTKTRLVSKSPVMNYIIDIVKTVADTNANILLEGESGTGKNVLAKYIHNLSSRRDKPFIKINCAAIPENLLESELFGYVKGAFTGAIKDKPGKVELADKGTLFLDEIGELPIYLQSKILHLIQEKEFERLGDVKTRKVDIRIIAATNKELSNLVKEGKFREDLYYRLKVISIKVPALRERKEDIPFLINHFVEIFSENYKKKIKKISPEVIKILLDYEFPGNIRELENIIERAVILSENGTIEKEHLPEEILDYKKRKENMLSKNNIESISEKEKIIEALKKTNGNKTIAAKILGIDRVTLWRKIRKYNIENYI